MIKREEYLNALDIVEAYHKQLNAYIRRHSFRNEDLKAGDTIVFDRVMSKYVEVGKEYKVIYVSPDFKKWHGTFEIMLQNNKTKMMKRYTQGYNWRIVDVMNSKLKSSES